LVSNQDNGIASYAVGGLVFHKATGGLLVNGPPFRPARLESVGLRTFIPCNLLILGMSNLPRLSRFADSAYKSRTK
jgi:hypothetical protein